MKNVFLDKVSSSIKKSENYINYIIYYNEIYNVRSFGIWMNIS